jgi:hypothetical protein
LDIAKIIIIIPTKLVSFLLAKSRKPGRKTDQRGMAKYMPTGSEADAGQRSSSALVGVAFLRALANCHSDQ